MKKSKLTIALGDFSKEEWISYRKYLLMHIREDSECFAVFKFLQLKKYTLSDLPELEKVRQKYFPGMSLKVLGNYISKLYIWLEQWIIHDHMLKDDLQFKLNLVKIYNRRGLYHLADQTANQLDKKLNQKKGYNIEQSKIKADLLYYQYYSDNPQKYIAGPTLLQEVVNSHLKYSSQKLQLFIAELYNWGELNNYDYQASIVLIDELINRMPEHELSQLMYHLKTMVADNNAESYYKLTEILYNDVLDNKSDLHIIVSLYLMAFSIRLWSKEKIRETASIFRIHNYCLETGIFLIDGKIDSHRFCITTSTLSYIGGQEETKKYIDQWVDIVNCKDTNSIKNLNYAINHFYHEKYEEALDCIIKAETLPSLERNLALDIQSIALYKKRFEDFELFQNHLNNFKRTLARKSNRRGKESSKQHLNLIKLLETMSDPDCNYNDINIHDYSPLIYRSWFLRELKRSIT